MSANRRNDDERHGTLAGAKRHSKRGEDPCDACRAAKAEYDKRWRGAPEQTRKNRLHARSQARANTELRHRYPNEWAEMYARHKGDVYREEGMEP